MIIFSHFDPVKANDRDVIRDRQTRGKHRFSRTDRNRIRSGKHCCKLLVLIQQSPRGIKARARTVFAILDQSGIVGQAVLFQRLLVAQKPPVTCRLIQ
ncbi:hypothetical protein D3C80_1734390 [compost metagenome]